MENKLTKLGLKYIDDFIPAKKKALIMKEVMELPLKKESITLFGKTHLSPRLSCFMGDKGISYQYSKNTFLAHPWSPLLLDLKKRLNSTDLFGLDALNHFNSVLINFYADGHDYMGWHQDNEPEIDVSHGIASISLGADREIKFKYKNENMVETLLLKNGSLLLMNGYNILNWKHALPKRLKVKEPRINLTFRKINT